MKSTLKSGEDDPELHQEVVDAWLNWCETTGLFPDATAKFDSWIGKRFVYLGNVNGLIAKYDIEKKTLIC